MTASCDTCRRPGACCSGFVIAAVGVFEPGPGWREEAIQQLERRGGIDYFEPMYPRASMNNPGMVQPIWRCRRLGADGRCTDYENRPRLCHLYEVGEDALCVEFVHQFKGIPLTWSRA